MLRRRLVSPAILCAFTLALAACGEKTSSDPRTEAPLVRVAVLQRTNPSSRSFTGTVAARVQSDLGFRVPGKVLERLVDAGQTVKRGQLLMRIDAADLKLAVNAQRQGVAAARALAKQTAADEARFRSLRQTGLISASTYDQAKAAADAAAAQLRVAAAQAEVAGNTRRYAELVADSDGVIMETLAEPGQVVGAGQAVVRMAHTGPREAVIHLPETLRPTIGSAGHATLFGKGHLSVPTRLRQLTDAADRSTRTFEARYVLQGELSNAPLGATVTIRIADGDSSAQDGFHVPVGALFDDGQGPGVWAIRGSSPAIVTRRPVSVLRVTDEGASIASGQLQPGDRIVALGAHLLRENQQVRVAPVSVAPTGGAKP